MKQLFFCLLLSYTVLTHAQESVFGIGTNFTVSSTFNSGSITPYLFYRNKKHHYGVGPMKGRRINASITNYDNIGSNSYLSQLGNAPGFTGLQIHYRYFPYEVNPIFDVFFEVQIASTQIKITKNNENYKNGAFFNTMGGLGFMMKFAKRFALTQTTLIGVKSMYFPKLDELNGFEKSFMLKPRLSIGITLGLEIKLF